MAAQPKPPEISKDLGRSMPDDLAATLRAQIHAGQLGPGDRLPNERDLAASLAIGRITVRQAVRTLVAEGYLTSKRGNAGGTYVSDLAAAHRQWIERVREDPQWLVDLIEYRKAVEMRAAELAARRRIARNLTDMRKAIADGASPTSRSAFRHADHRFHLAMAEASGSERLLSAIVQARGELFVPVDHLAFRDHFSQTHDEHTAILAAIENRDPDEARAMTEAHLDGSLHDLLEMIVHVPDQ